MYATINLPGSSHFEYYGPASRAECEAWLARRVEELSRTEQITSLMPQRVISDRDAESWRYRDGSRVINPGRAEAEREMWRDSDARCKNPECDKPLPVAFSHVDFCDVCCMFCVVRADGTVNNRAF